MTVVVELVAVVLLIGAVRFEQLHAGLAKALTTIAEFPLDLTAEIVAFDLENFDRTRFFFVRHGTRRWAQRR